MAKKKSKKDAKSMNETGRRKSSDRRQKTESGAKATSERRRTNRRRQIDPTTCEREYTDAEIEFMQALDEYKRQSGRMFPTCSEILEVLQKLGYQKVDMAAHQCCQSGGEESIANEIEIGMTS